ncbi:hypothetical protein [Rhodobacter ferrooxidans]|uniref:Uncharacterized protein n=1 Tax=Rhodobacter ferrooxidans TaxID=371731 RepID=C8S390_9RHOB|nr:hypothetical protein [Rhodobacter sp. SW2]EEW24572.1 conserved hypothetical protein [Rhodobacter sp. SW2]
MKKFLLGTALCLSTVAGPAAYAQTALFDAGAIAAACSGQGASCLSVIAQIVAALQAAGLPADQLNSQLAAVANAALDAARAAPTPEILAAVAAGLETVAAASSDPAQAAALQALASNVAAGDIPNPTAVAQQLEPVSGA